MCRTDALIRSFTQVKAEESRQGHMGRPTSYGQLALEYDNRGVLASCNVDVVNGPTVGLAAVVNLMGGLRLGAAAALNTQLDENDRPPEVVEHALGMQFRGQGWEASLATLNKFHSVEASFMQCLGDRGKVGAILTQRLLGRSRTQMVTGGWWNVAPGSELRVREHPPLAFKFPQEHSLCTNKATGLSLAGTNFFRRSDYDLFHPAHERCSGNYVLCAGKSERCRSWRAQQIWCPDLARSMMSSGTCTFI
jgi:hypothetical protein